MECQMSMITPLEFNVSWASLSTMKSPKLSRNGTGFLSSGGHGGPPTLGKPHWSYCSGPKTKDQGLVPLLSRICAGAATGFLGTWEEGERQQRTALSICHNQKSGFPVCIVTPGQVICGSSSPTGGAHRITTPLHDPQKQYYIPTPSPHTL